MSLFDLFLGKRPEPKGQPDGSFKMLSGYEPVFTNFMGSIYESELIRASIEARANHISKLKPHIQGSARPTLKKKLEKAPNNFQTWSQFLRRLSTILDVHNTAFIIPTFDEYGEQSGIFTALPNKCEVVSFGKVPYLRYTFKDNQTAAIEMSYCRVMTKFQYRSDVFGETNAAMLPTLDMISITNQGIKEATKSSASYRFWAKATNFAKTDDLAKERKRFSEANLSKEADGGGVLIFPNTYSDIHQVEAKPWVLSAEQMKQISENVFRYFGTNEAILRNEAYGDKWTAFYEGVVETFAIQFSELVTSMLYSQNEQSRDNLFMLTANRLQYMSTQEKLNVSKDLADRGVLNRDEVREIWNLPPLPNGEGQAYIIRGEYWNATEKIVEGGQEDEQGD